MNKVFNINLQIKYTTVSELKAALKVILKATKLFLIFIVFFDIYLNNIGSFVRNQSDDMSKITLELP